MKKLLDILNNNENVLQKPITLIELMVFVRNGMINKNKDPQKDTFIIKGILNYLSNHNAEFKELGESKILSNLLCTNLLINNIDKKEIQALFSEYKIAIQKYTEKYLYHMNNLSSEYKNSNIIQSIKNLEKTYSILENIVENENQKTFSELQSLTDNILSEQRFNKLNEILNTDKDRNCLDIDLILSILFSSEEKHKNNLENIFQSISLCRDSFSRQEIKPNALTSIVGFLQNDLCKKYFHSGINIEEINTTELWSNIQRYNLNNISKVETPFITLNEKKCKEYLYVYTQDNEFFISPIKQGDQIIQHIMLANGKPVFMAGMIYLNEKNNPIRVDNSSGHYKPEIDRVKYLIDCLLKENPELIVYDTQNNIEQISKDIIKNDIKTKINHIRNNESKKTLSLN